MQSTKLVKNPQICAGIRGAVRYDRSALLARRGNAMLLHCEKQGSPADDGATLAAGIPHLWCGRHLPAQRITKTGVEQQVRAGGGAMA